jgi:hypothetical protein
MDRKNSYQEVFYVEKVPGDILQGLGWVKVDLEVAQRLSIPHQYMGTVVIPNTEPYCCPVKPDDKTKYYQLAYQAYYYIYPPTPRGKSKKLLLHNNGEVINLAVQNSLAIKAVKEWVKIWSNPDAKLITPGGKLVTLTGEFNTGVAFVYFILNRDSNSVKIGRAKDVDKRLKSLQTSSPVTLELLKIIQVNGMEEAKNLERSLHAKFSHLRMSREWFKVTQELISYLQHCTVSHPQEAIASNPKPYRSVPISEL